MISAEDIQAFTEEAPMGAHKDIYTKAGEELTKVEYEARPYALNLQRLVQPALDFMAKLPVDSYLIGGSLRDTIVGRPIRDFDIYVGPDFTDEMLDALVEEYTLSVISNGQEYTGQVAWGSCNFDRKISRIVELVAHDLDFPAEQDRFQIMVLKEWFATPEAASRSVDFGICQISYNLKTGLHCTADFFRDCINRTFTFMPEGRSENDRLRSIARFNRLNADKYQGYKPVGLDKEIV